MNFKEILAYYSREDVQEFLLNFAKNREVVGVYKNGKFGTRPNALLYKNDILSMVKAGIVEFHSSIEHWSNPMLLKETNYNELRTGFDLVIDLDLEYKSIAHGQIAAKSFIWGLEKHGIKNFSLKYTGGSGFHLAIPWSSMPKKIGSVPIDYNETIKLFPKIAKIIILYLRDFVKEEMEKQFFKKYSPDELATMLNKPLGKILTTDGLDLNEVEPSFVDTDSILLSPRHLFRMPYSLHCGSFLVSVPIKTDDLDDFKKQDAMPSKVKIKEKFLDFDAGEEAELLVTEALDWWAKKPKEKEKSKRKFRIEKAIAANFFPPCIKTILKGLPDGKKRSLFILINFLRSLGWSSEQIEKLVNEWNKKNIPPLGESYVKAQLNYQKNKKILPPPSCKNEAYYTSFGVCKPDNFCGGSEKTVKNPVIYPFRVLKGKKLSEQKPAKKSKFSKKKKIGPMHSDFI